MRISPFTLHWKRHLTLLASLLAMFLGGIQQTQAQPAYCTPSHGATACGTYFIDDVSLNGMTNLNSGCSNLSGTAYNLYPASSFTTSLVIGQTYPLTIELGGTSATSISVWIDWDADGTYASNEHYQLAGTTTATTPPIAAIGSTTTVNITVPANASTSSLFGMRIRTRTSGSPNGPGDACLTFGSGETEQYFISAVNPAPCVGTPNTPAASAPSSVCPSTTFALSSSNVTQGTTNQWEESFDGVNFTPLAGGVFSFFNDTINSARFYRLASTCSATTVFSNVIQVNIASFLTCYCTPSHSNTCAATPTSNITNVTVSGSTLNNTSTCGSGTGSVPYTLFPATGSTTGNIQAGGTITLSVSGPSTGTDYAAWFDWNQNGVFDITEYYSLTTANVIGTPNVINIAVPNGATPGQTRLRVRGSTAALPATAACINSASGESEDYIVTVLALPSCTTPPTTGTLSAANGTAVCFGSTSNLTLTGYGLGTSLQVQESTDGVNYTDVSGATSQFYTTPATNDTIYYRYEVTCSAQVAFSNVLMFTLNSPISCYCTPIHTNTCAATPTNIITNVTVSGSTLNNTSVCAGGVTGSSPATSYPATGSTTGDIQAGDLITLSVSVNSAGTDAAAWFDWNQNGLFETTEYYSLTTANVVGTPNTVSIAVPNGATPGLTGMRVRSSTAALPAGNACTSSASGESEDYLVTILALPACTTPPTTGTLSSSAGLDVCSGSTTTLSLSGYGLGTSLQLESSLDGFNWTDVTGVTSQVYNAPAVTDTIYYRYEVTCLSQVDYSNVIQINLAGPTFCYCFPSHGTTACTGSFINNVTLNTLSNLGSGCTNLSGTAVNLYPTSSFTTTLNRQTNYTLSVQIGGTSGTSFSVWFDWDGNGTYASNEHFQLAGTTTTTTPAILPVGGSATLNFTVPANAALGNIGMRMRIRTSGSANGPGDACSTFGSGETEQYFITIAPAPVCTLPHVAGAVSPASTSICTGSSTSLLLSGYTLGSSLQWEESINNGATWTPITGATNGNFIATPTVSTTYRVAVTCSATTLFSSTSVVNINSFLVCYCTPLHTNTCTPTATNVITAASFGNFSNASGGCVGTPYSQHDSATFSSPAVPGSSYQLSVTSNTAGADISAWFDWNRNGTFETTEYTSLTTAAVANTPVNVSITVPGGASLGWTRMRIRASATTLGSGTPCTSLASGETEDYYILITNVVTCALPPTAGTIAGANNLCPATTTTLSLTGASFGTAVQWQSSTDNVNFLPVTGATTGSLLVGPITSTTYYRVAVTCSAQTVFTPSFTITLNGFLACYCFPSHGTTACTGTSIDDVTLNTLSNQNSGCTNLSGTAVNLYPASSFTTTLERQQTYTLSVTVNGTSSLSVWFDWNADGVYSANEHYQVAGTGTTTVPPIIPTNGTVTAQIMVPAGAALGQIGMRMRIRTSGSANGPGDACLQFGSGETEQYIITIAPAPPCVLPVAAGSIQGDNTRCQGTTQSLIVNGYSQFANLQWLEATNNGPWTVAPGANNAVYTTSALTTAIQNFALVAECSGNTDTTFFTVNRIGNTYASLPVTQSFEANWLSVCAVNDAPNNFWRVLQPASGNAWRRNDDNTSAGWVSNTLGTFTPVSTAGTHSARMHSYANVATNGTFSDLDLYVSLNGNANKLLTFDQINTAGNDSLVIFLSIDGGVTFTRQTSFGIAATWTERTVDFGAINAPNCVVRFRGYTVASNFTDIGIDNVNLRSVIANEIGAIAISVPNNNSCSLPSTVFPTVTVRNYGAPLAAGTVIPVRLRQGANQIDESFTLANQLAINATIQFTFTTPLTIASGAGTFVMQARTRLVGDPLGSNNDTSITLNRPATYASLPVIENFEGPNHGWSAGGTNSSWQLGTPASTFSTAGDVPILGAASGTKAWTTGLGTPYNVNEASFVLSPCYDFTGVTVAPWVSLNAWWQSENNWDGASLQYSFDNGVTWERVGPIATTGEWYNNTTFSSAAVRTFVDSAYWNGRANGTPPGSKGYVHRQTQLPTILNGKPSVRFRFTFGTDGSVVDSNGFAFDDFTIAATRPAATALRSQDCGFMRFSKVGARSVIGVTSVASVDSYEFTFDPTGAGNNIIVNSSTPFYNLSSSALAYGATYSVTIRTVRDNIKSIASTPCTIALVGNPAISVPNTQLRSDDCGYADFTLNTGRNYVGADAVAGADNYSFEFTNTTTSVTETYSTTSRFATFPDINAAFPGFIQYGQSYDVRVRATVDGILGSYGLSCNVALIAAPIPALTQLRPFDCGATRSVDTSYLIANPVAGGTSYTFNFFTAPGAALPYASLVNTGEVIVLADVTPSLIYGTTYYVTVDVSQDGVPAFGTDTCLVYIAPVTPRLTGAGQGNVDMLSLYPNPSRGAATLEGSNIASIEVADLAGRIVEQRNVTTNRTMVGAGLKAGAYTVHVTMASGEVRSLRLVLVD